MVPFSGEEGLGRFLDLHEAFQTFTNSKFGKQLDYYTYVAGVADFAALPRAQRLTKSYRDYLTALLAYLESFYERTQPLAQLAKHYEKVIVRLGVAVSKWPPSTAHAALAGMDCGEMLMHVHVQSGMLSSSFCSWRRSLLSSGRLAVWWAGRIGGRASKQTALLLRGCWTWMLLTRRTNSRFWVRLVEFKEFAGVCILTTLPK